MRPVVLLSVLTVFFPPNNYAANNQVLGWNNLGMHCMDSDYSVFSILPPYNTIEAQLIVERQRSSPTATVTPSPIRRSPTRPVRSTPRRSGKGNFYDFVQPFLRRRFAGRTRDWRAGTCPAPTTRRRRMLVRAAQRAGARRLHPGQLVARRRHSALALRRRPQKNPYPMMRLIARDAANSPSPPTTSSCRSPTKWTAAPATPPARRRPPNRSPAGSGMACRNAISG